MGKMVDAQSIVVASTATRWFNHEGDILRYVFFHSIALAWQADLLMVGTHGRHGVERLLVGSVAENLMRLSPGSLLMVR